MNLQEKWKETKLKKTFAKPCMFDSCQDGHYLAVDDIALKII